MKKYYFYYCVGEKKEKSGVMFSHNNPTIAFEELIQHLKSLREDDYIIKKFIKL